MEIVNKKDLLQFIADKIRNDKRFEIFSIKSNNKTLLLGDDLGSYRIELNVHLSYDLDRNESSNEVIPYFYRKFDILHDWFKEFTALSSADFKSYPSTFVSGEKMNIKNEYHFLVNNRDFILDFQSFLEDLNKGSVEFVQTFKSLNDFYNYEVNPIIKNKNYKFIPHEFDGYFFMLKLVYIIDPSEFDDLNSRIHSHLKTQAENEHPHAMHYLAIYESIIEKLISN